MRAFLLESEGMEGEISSPLNQLGTHHTAHSHVQICTLYTYTTLRALLPS